MSKTPEGSPSRVDVKNNTPEGSPSIAGVENNSKKLSVVFEKMGQVAAKAVHVIREAYAAERIDVDAKRPENDEGVMERLGFPGNTENSTGASEGSTDTSKPGANKSEAKKSKANNSSGEQASNAKPKTTKGEADASQGKNAGEGTKSTSGEQASNAKPKTTKGEADASQGKNASGAAADFMKKFLDKSKQDQGSSAAGSSEDKQDKDSNPNTGEAQTKETSPEKREAADELEKAKDRHSKASAAAESKNPLGKKRRQAELKAATEELKKRELVYKAAVKLDEDRERFAKASVDFEIHFFEGKKRRGELNAATEELKKSGLKYMCLKFADKIEAAKQDPEKQAELAAEMAQAAFASMQETSRVTTDKYDNMLDDRSKFKKAVAQVGKWFNKGGRIAQWLKPGGAGFAAGTATGFLAGYAGYAGFPITMAVGAVTGLGFAGLTKQAVLEERRGEDRIDADARLETTDPSFKNTVANMKIDDVMEHAVNVSVDNLKDMSIERQDALHKKVKASLGKYSIGFALGGVFGGSINHLLNNSAHATGAGSQKTPATPSQSGSGQIPQQSGSTSSMHNIVNSANLDTSNFSSYDYPWDWAADKFGNANAMDQLRNLADKAMANGHTVQWFNNPDGSVWMKVDGSSVTADVLGVLNQYV